MFLIQQTQTGRNRKESLVPIRSTIEDLKIEILDVNTMGGFTVIDGSGFEQVVEVVTSDETSQDENSGSRPRKRAKLDHLSAEQKAQHRKMMNRISAQSARDRQRALMNQQEDSLKKLNTSFDQMKDEIKSLKKRNETLVAENAAMKAVTAENEKLKSLVAELESKLKSAESSPPSTCVQVPDSVIMDTSCSSSEPAVPTVVPLPKGLEVQLALIFTLLIWECSNGILTLQKYSKFWRAFHEKYLAKTPLLQRWFKTWPADAKSLRVKALMEKYLQLKPPD